MFRHIFTDESDVLLVSRGRGGTFNMKRLMIGNEAISRGAYEAGASVAAAYPGTPSTEIVSNFARYKDVYAEWAPNEKVALEVGIGASLGGPYSGSYEACRC